MTDQNDLGGTPAPEDTPVSHEPATPKTHQRNIYIIAAVLIVLALVIVNARSADDEPSTDSTSQADDIVVTIDDGSGSEVVFNGSDFVQGYSTQTFEDLDEAGLIINSTQGKPTSGDGSEKLVSNIVESTESDMVYFATQSFNEAERETFVGIYHYNTVSNRWQRVYKDTLSNEEDQKAMLRVVARSGNHLILSEDEIGRQQELCENHLLSEELLLLNLEDPYAGFTDFPLPAELRQEAQQQQEICLNQS